MICPEGNRKRQRKKKKVSEPVRCSSCKRTVAQLQGTAVILMVYHKKPLIAFCTTCKKTWPENVKPFKGQVEEEEEE